MYTDFEVVLDDLSTVLEPVANNGASRDELQNAVKHALDVIADAYEDMEDDEDEDDEDEEEDEPAYEGEDE